MIAQAQAVVEMTRAHPVTHNETDNAVDHAPAGPQRRCLVTRESLPKEALVRFVVGPDGNVVPDIEGKLPGRGLWVTSGRPEIETAVAKGKFSRAAKARVSAPADLADEVERQLMARALNILGLARRSGAFVSGYDTVRDTARKTPPAVLVAAADGSDGALAKLKAMAPGAPVVRLFTADELGRAIGRENVVNAMLMPGSLAERFLAEAGRVAGFRNIENDVAGDIDGKVDGV